MVYYLKMLIYNTIAFEEGHLQLHKAGYPWSGGGVPQNPMLCKGMQSRVWDTHD